MKHTVYQAVSLFLFGILLCTACGSDNEDENEVAVTEDFTPLNCTIPGELQLNGETKSILSQYQK
jgi:hypothetical protein